MILQNIIRFIVLVLLQALVFNNIELGGYLNPFIYVMFILLLPFETPPWLLLLSSFFLGFSVDLFSGSLGIHTAASVLMAYSRPGVIRFVASKREFEPGIFPGIRDLGIVWFLSYSSLLILIHHTVLYFIDSFSFRFIIDTFTRIILGSALTLTLIIVSQYLFYKQKE